MRGQPEIIVIWHRLPGQITGDLFNLQGSACKSSYQVVGNQFLFAQLQNPISTPHIQKNGQFILMTLVKAIKLSLLTSRMAGLKKGGQIIDPLATLQIQTALQRLAIEIQESLKYLTVGTENCLITLLAKAIALDADLAPQSCAIPLEVINLQQKVDRSIRLPLP